MILLGKEDRRIILEEQICNRNKFDEKECINEFDEIHHKGTLVKIAFMQKYIEAWLQKILQYKDEAGTTFYEGVMFIDCMANSGAYQYEKNIEWGTSVVGRKIFEKKHNHPSFSNKKFTLVVNDIKEAKINCQNCLMKQYSDFVDFRSYNKDVRKFLIEDAPLLLAEAKRNKQHVLLFYDPYLADIYWSELQRFFVSEADVIITHFIQSDTKRGLLAAKKIETQERYAKTYGLPYSVLEAQYKEKDPYSQNTFLRDRIISQVKRYCNPTKRRHIAYAPVFNDRKVLVYDILCISPSIEGKVLLKNNMYSLYKDFHKANHINEQTDLFSFNEVKAETDYNILRMFKAEPDMFYNEDYFADLIQNYFSGREIDKKEFDDFIKFHDIIPESGAKNTVKAILIARGNMEQIPVPGKSNKSIKGYRFKELGERDE